MHTSRQHYIDVELALGTSRPSLTSHTHLHTNTDASRLAVRLMFEALWCLHCFYRTAACVAAEVAVLTSVHRHSIEGLIVGSAKNSTYSKKNSQKFTDDELYHGRIDFSTES